MKKAAVTFLLLSLLLLIGQAVSGAPYSSFIYPLALIMLAILPPLYLVLYLTRGKKLVFILGYAVLTLLILMFQRGFQPTANDSIMTTAPLLLVLQVGLWVQYYFWDRHQPEALTQGGNFQKDDADKIRDLITAGRLEEAMERMTTGDELSAEQQTVVSNFAFRLNEIQRKEAMGLLTDEEVSVQRNQIVTGILSFL